MATMAVQSNNKTMPCSLEAYTDRFLMSSSTGKCEMGDCAKKLDYKSLRLCVITRIIFVLKFIKIAS
jgi:hypothetical protein